MTQPLTRRSFVGALAGAGFAAGAGADRPNVLSISVDDMNDWTQGLGGYSGTVHTPNQERLASRGVNFNNAHCPAPWCAPSRAATFLGLRPSTTGVYNNGQWWKPAHPDVVTMPAHFRGNGYRTVGAGKLLHHTAVVSYSHTEETDFCGQGGIRCYHLVCFVDDGSALLTPDKLSTSRTPTICRSCWSTR